MASNTTQDLMASLMGGGDEAPATNGDGAGESDLFGDIPIVDPMVSAATPAPEQPKPQDPSNGVGPTFQNQDPSLIVPPIPNDPLAAPPAAVNDPLGQPPVAAPVPPTPTTSAPEPPVPTGGPSLLMQSGLLGDTPDAAPEATPSDAAGTDDGGLFASVDQEEAKRAQAEAEEVERQRLEAEQRHIELEKQKQLEHQKQQQLEQQQQQQLQDQMQSVYLGNGPPPQQNQQQQPQQNNTMMHQSHMGGGTMGNPPGAPTSIPSQPGYLSSPPPQAAPNHHQQQQQQQQQQTPLANDMPANNMDSFYRSDPSTQQMGFPGQQASMMQQHQHQSGDANRYYQPAQNVQAMAGMHNVGQSKSLGQAPILKVVKPEEVNTFYDKVVVSEPLLVAQPKGLLGSLTGQSTPHWSYQITTYFKPPPNQQNQQQHAQYWVVRRRFRHVVALEDRLHDEIPGAILPPRPDKHATRALEEATTQQSTEFAVQRAAELQVYMNQLIQHPFAFNTQTLRLFLSLQDDLGIAWPEVSNNAFTRLANASVGAAVKVSETTQATKFPWQDPMGQIDDYGEDNAELLALSNQEQMRMASVLQSVPKLEGAITLLREGAERMGSTGMELGRLSKEVAGTDMALGQPMDIVSNGMLRSGRRNKRLALELFAALHSYSQHYKTCRYEKQAFMDRRLAIMRRQKERGRADQQASALYQQQQQQMYQQPYGGGHPQQQQPGGFQPPQYQQPYGNSPAINQYQNQAVMADNSATDAWQDCDEIGQRLRSEINRLAYSRRTDWFNAVKVVASSYKEATTENVAIWQAVQESYLQAFPQYEDEVQRQPSTTPPLATQGIPQEQQVPP